MTRRAVLLTDETTGCLVEAELDLELGPRDLELIEASCGPLRREAAQRLSQGRAPGAVPEHWHWDWRRKGFLLQVPTYRCLGIRYGTRYQGIAIIAECGHKTRLEPLDEPLIYIEFIEVAPWNNAQLVAKRRYKPVGPRLLEAVIRLSRDEGYGGRIGLHSLPQSEGFYDRCGLTRLSADAKEEGLRYFEMTVEQAEAFLRRGAQ